MKTGNVTIHEIARECGVSVATVSRVINGSGRFSQETGERVREAVARLGYVPDAGARALRRRENRLVGILVNELDYEMTGRIVFCLQEALYGAGYLSVLCNIGNHAEKQAEMLEVLRGMSVKCLFVAALRTAEPIPEDYPIPAVYIYKDPCPGAERALSCRVLTDDEGAGRLAAEELARAGCRTVTDMYMAFPGTENDPVQPLRHTGFVTRAKELGLVYDADAQLRPSVRGHGELARYLADRLETARADGYFCASDVMSTALVNALWVKRLYVPGDVKIVGCNDIEMMVYASVPLTSVRHDLEGICRAAVNKMEELCVTGAACDERVPVTLVRRVSTGTER